MTNEAGEYTIDGVPAGTYSLGAVKTGYLLRDAMGVVLQSKDTTQVNLVCKADSTLTLGAIAGVVDTVNLQGVHQPMDGVKLTLRDSLGATLATTYSSDDGEFVFYDVADGTYTLLASADGYLTSAPLLAVITGGSIANVTITLAEDSRTYNGTVSGTIRDSLGHVVAGCFVGLYQLVTQSGEVQERLVATTKTNEAGQYLFGGVEAGQYLVKAKLSI